MQENYTKEASYLLSDYFLQETVILQMHNYYKEKETRKGIEKDQTGIVHFF